MRTNAETTLSGESDIMRHKNVSGFSTANPAWANSLRLKSLRFQVMTVTTFTPDCLRAVTAAAAT